MLLALNGAKWAFHNADGHPVKAALGIPRHRRDIPQSPLGNTWVGARHKVLPNLAWHHQAPRVGKAWHIQAALLCPYPHALCPPVPRLAQACSSSGALFWAQDPLPSRWQV